MRLPRIQSESSRPGPWLGRGYLAAYALLALFGLVVADRLKGGPEGTILLTATLVAVALLPVLLLEVIMGRRIPSEGRFLEAVFQGSPMPIFALDREGRVYRFWNAAAQTRFRMSTSRALGRPAPLALGGCPGEVGRLLARAFAGENFAGIPGQGLVLEGPAFPLNLSLTPVPGAGRQVEAVLVVVEDVSEARGLEKQLLHIQKVETAGEFLVSITHDFNNILMSIMGHNDFLLRDPRLDADQKRRLEVIRRGAGRGHALASRLLRYARKGDAQRQTTDLNELVAEVMALLRDSAGPSVLFHSQLDPDLPFTLVEPSEIHQVIMNLGVNARDAMPGGGELTFRTRVAGPAEAGTLGLQAAAGPVILLEIQDTGSGIPAEVREHIFEPFYTTKADGKGTGLGLAVVDRIIRAHGGLVRCLSGEGKGALFQVLLPVE